MGKICHNNAIFAVSECFTLNAFLWFFDLFLSVPDVAKIKSYTSTEVNGWIYLWYHAEGSEPTWQIPVIPEIQSGDWVYNGRTEHYINCHIEVGARHCVNIWVVNYLVVNVQHPTLTRSERKSLESSFAHKVWEISFMEWYVAESFWFVDI